MRFKSNSPDTLQDSYTKMASAIIKPTRSS